MLVDSEHVWDDVREGLAHERGGRWTEHAQADMMGMSSTEWSIYMHDVIGLPESPEAINAEVAAYGGAIRRALASRRGRFEAWSGWPARSGSRSRRRRIVR